MLFQIKDKRKFAVEICAALLVLLYIYAAASKVIDFEKYTGEMNNQPFDNRFTPLLTYGIPTAECIVAILLSLDRMRRWGFISSLVMMTLFTGYIAIILMGFYDRVPCTCGGVISQLGWKWHMIFNLFFIGVSITGLRLTRRGLPPPDSGQLATSF